MAAIGKDFGAGGAGLQPGFGTGLAEHLRGIVGDISAISKKPAWTTGIVVTSHVAVLVGGGWVLNVHATAGGAAGPKQIIQTGAPAAGQVRVDFDGNGVPTLTFATADAVTAAAAMVLPWTAQTTTAP